MELINNFFFFGLVYDFLKAGCLPKENIKKFFLTKKKKKEIERKHLFSYGCHIRNKADVAK